MIFGLKKLRCIKQCILAIIFSNSFTYNQAEQIKKGVICVQILLEIHLTEHGRFHFQGRRTFYTPALVPPSRHMTSKWHAQMASVRLDDVTQTSV